MKKFTTLFVSLAAAAMALVSCQVEESVINEPVSEAKTIRVHATAQDLANEDTKTYINGEETILWGTGEYMKLAVTAGENTVFASSTDASANLFDGEPTALFEFSVSPASAAEYLYQGIYPASAAVANSNTNPANYKVNLPATQNATATSYDPAAYIMVAKPESFDQVESDWTVKFRRATALNKITLKNVPGGVSIKRVKITATAADMYLAGGRHINLSTGESGDIYNGGGRTETVEVKFATPAAGGSNIDVWFTSWQVELEAGNTLTIVAYTTDKKSYTKTINLTGEQKISFKEGYLNTLGANMSGIDPEDVTELEEGDYVILAKNGDNYYAVTAALSGNHLASSNYTESISSYNGDADLIWTVSKSGSSYIFANSGKYIGYKGSSNEAYWFAPEASVWEESNYLIDVTWDGSNSCYHATLNSNSNRKFSRNGSSDYFAFYTSDQQKDLLFVPATVDNRTAVTLSFDEDAVNFTTADYDSFLGQDVTVSPDVAAITGHLNWSKVDNDDVIDDFDDGVLTLTGNEGTATVTVSFAGDVDYKSAEASYTITVTAAGGPSYELVSDAESVVAGSYIITWDNAYYLPSGSESGTNPAVGTGITVSANKITNNVTSDMVWTFTGDNTNGFTISDGTYILHSTNAAQGISINTTSTRKWTVSVDGTYGMLLSGDDEGSRNLAVYNNSGTRTWRYYATGGNYSGVLRLYKLVDTRNDASLAWKKGGVEANSDTASIEDGDDVLPTITLDNSAHSHPVTYSSSNTDVATIVESGVGAGTITLVAAGETIISAIFAGDEDYKPLTVSYTLTVEDNRAPSYDFTTVAELNALVTSSSSSYNGYLTDAVVSFAPTTGTAFVKDATGSVMIYKSGHGLLQGQTYTGAIEVTAVLYTDKNSNSLYSEVTAWDATFSGAGAVVNPEVVALSSIIGHYDDYQNAYVSIAGLTVSSVNGQNINVTDGENTYVVYDNTGNVSVGAGDVITAVGTITKYQTTEELKVWSVSDITVTSSAPKAITFSQPTGAAGTAGCSFTVSVGNSPIDSGDTVASGTTVTLTATAGTDYEFTEWTVEGATVDDASAASTTFVMGTSAVTVSASFSSTSGNTQDYTVTWTATAAANLGSTISSVNGTATGTITVAATGGTPSHNVSYTRTLISGSDYMGYGAGFGIQLGKNGGVENIEFRTSNIPGTIKSVTLNCSSYQSKHNVSITVGGNTYKASTATASGQSPADITGTGDESGEIVISVTGGTRYVCIKSITVVYNN